MAYMPVTSKEELRVGWGADFSAWPVELAVVLETSGEPADSEYHDAAWDGTDAVLVIGQGSSLELAPGQYVVWTRITTSTQRPVRRSGILTVGEP
ncbi:hypothetical protein [Nonomuraea roseoviolacea]|uniref:Uncharacterized protein n=1 Tax=Nonomuraea roseoviolacea subsp. carminata TaxID=160689 RepID=A0ABT1KCB2_9ACTN|nr:hypothetical protein [Nonomuraea roseoviolacea]MCP2350629.1 hypothetical protein [Nonomuraea roseoviolacea subsp. carminata]